MSRADELAEAEAFFVEGINQALTMIRNGATYSLVAQSSTWGEVNVLTDGVGRTYVSAASKTPEPLRNIRDCPPHGATCTLIDVKRFGRFCLRIYPS